MSRRLSVVTTARTIDSASTNSRRPKGWTLMCDTMPPFSSADIFSGQSRDDPPTLWGDLSNIDFTGTFSLSGSQMQPEMGFHIVHEGKVTRSEQ